MYFAGHKLSRSSQYPNVVVIGHSKDNTDDPIKNKLPLRVLLGYLHDIRPPHDEWIINPDINNPWAYSDLISSLPLDTQETEIKREEKSIPHKLQVILSEGLKIQRFEQSKDEIREYRMRNAIIRRVIYDTHYKCNFCNNHKAENRCSKCKYVFYCNRKCQLADKKTHKIICQKPDQNFIDPRKIHKILVEYYDDKDHNRKGELAYIEGIEINSWQTLDGKYLDYSSTIQN